ncbi:hypothetical protein PSAB_19540 [Paenibacillus sabinae T27]|uniref:Uncharacterized protein n=1 Tax=Paenibacillus sabinae T27 TaxID=1268072 RepID=X4ZH30_9BACL|nr:hypothetical protein PSAB_19540 [Paenibacillus sabinae T27]
MHSSTDKMVINDFILPITHRFQNALNGFMIDVLALLKPTMKALSGYPNIWRVPISVGKSFFPFPNLAQQRR